MDISPRLKTIAEKVSYRTVADIGTDHGYIPIYLAEKGLIDRAAACDINKGPLLRAESNIKKYGFEDIVEVRLGDGLKPVEEDEFESLVIAGMGGMLIIDILKNSLEYVVGVKQLVLQPQLDLIAVRRFVHSIGFKIVDEEYIFDDNKYYTVLSCIQGRDSVYDCADYIFGKVAIEKKDSMLKNYILFEIGKNIKILKNIKDAAKGTQPAREKAKEVEKYIDICYEVLKCL